MSYDDRGGWNTYLNRTEPPVRPSFSHPQFLVHVQLPITKGHKSDLILRPRNHCQFAK